MGHKNICFNCRKSFNVAVDSKSTKQAKCPECGQAMTLMIHRFRPPKKDDNKKWETVKYLVDHGFTYQQIREEVETKDERIESVNVPYPENLRDAKEFVRKYKNKAINK